MKKEEKKKEVAHTLGSMPMKPGMPKPGTHTMPGGAQMHGEMHPKKGKK